MQFENSLSNVPEKVLTSIYIAFQQSKYHGNCISITVVTIWTASSELGLIAYASSEGSGSLI